jgi:hypothetical protein
MEPIGPVPGMGTDGEDPRRRTVAMVVMTLLVVLLVLLVVLALANSGGCRGERCPVQ